MEYINRGLTTNKNSSYFTLWPFRVQSSGKAEPISSKSTLLPSEHATLTSKLRWCYNLYFIFILDYHRFFSFAVFEYQVLKFHILILCISWLIAFHLSSSYFVSILKFCQKFLVHILNRVVLACNCADSARYSIANSYNPPFFAYGLSGVTDHFPAASGLHKKFDRFRPKNAIGIYHK